MNDIADKYPTIITFYTPTWQYKEYALKMKEKCEELGLHFHSKEYESTGNWLKNTTIKPKFIYESMRTLKRPILWIDADGTLCGLPDELDNNCEYDFAARIKQIPDNRVWHVGTLYFNYTEACLKFVEEWVARIDAGFDGSDELCLDILWKEKHTQYELNTGKLSGQYFEMLKGLDSIPKPDTIIAHRASGCTNKRMVMAKRKKDGKGS